VGLQSRPKKGRLLVSLKFYLTHLCFLNRIRLDIKIKTIMPKIKLDVKIPISVLKEGDNFVVYSPAFDLSTSAKTYKRALSRLNEIVEIFFEEILKRGTLEEALKELGWRRVRTKWQPPLVISQDLQRIHVVK